MKKTLIALLALAALTAGCASYNAFERGRTAERAKDWDDAVIEFQKALEVDPGNMRFQIYLQRATPEASRAASAAAACCAFHPAEWTCAPSRSARLRAFAYSLFPGACASGC